MLQVQTPFQQFFDLDGDPLDNGDIYIGGVNQNPQTDPIAIFWDEAGTQPAAQPLKTSNGYLVRNGTPARVYVNESDYSMTVRDVKGRVVFTALDSTSLADSSKIMFIQAGIGAVEREAQSKMREFISVEDFGAVGDGTTDDTLAIQAALNTGPFTQIEFPPGVYLTGPLTVGPDVRLVGRGMTISQLKLKSGSSGALLTIQNGTHTTLQDIGLDGNKSGNPLGGSCVVIDGAELTGNGLWFNFVGFFNAKTFGLYQTGTYSKISITNCVVEGCDFDGIALTTAGGSLIQGNRCVSNGRFGILVQTDYCRIEGNICQNNGVTMAGGAGIGVVGGEFIIALGNNCFGNTGHGIQFNDVANGVQSSNVCHNNTISGLDCYNSRYCTVSSNTSFLNTVRGIEIDSASYYCAVLGNIVYRNLETGISIFRSASTIIVGNHSTENGAGGSAQYGIRLWDDANTLPSSNCRIIGNNCTDDRGGSATQQFGISIENNATGIILVGNTLLPNVNKAVNLVSGEILYSVANQGYNLSKKAAALTLQNGWVAYDANWQSPASFVDPVGIVRVVGAMKSGTVTPTTVVATLPVGQRPIKVAGPFRLYAIGGGAASVYVLTNGDIVAQATLDATLTSLDGITFEAGQ